MTPVRRVLGLFCVSVVVLAGCKVDARVDVTLHADGSGTVTARVALDADAVSRLTTHAPLTEAVPLDDVRAAGWEVSGWKPSAGGGDAITVSHEFTGEADLAHRLGDLVGSTGVLRDPTITQTRGWFRATDSIAVAVDLRHLPTGIRSDPQVVRALTAAGVDVNALDAQLRSELGHALTVRVTVHAPEGASGTVNLGAGGGGTAAASGSRAYAKRIVLVSVGLALVTLAVLLTAVSLGARLRRRRARVRAAPAPSGDG